MGPQAAGGPAPWNRSHPIRTRSARSAAARACSTRSHFRVAPPASALGGVLRCLGCVCLDSPPRTVRPGPPSQCATTRGLQEGKQRREHGHGGGGGEGAATEGGEGEGERARSGEETGDRGGVGRVVGVLLDEPRLLPARSVSPASGLMRAAGADAKFGRAWTARFQWFGHMAPCCLAVQQGKEDGGE